MANSNGTYGTRRPADITTNDVDIFYHYRPDRSRDSEDFPAFKRLASTYLTQYEREADTADGLHNVLPNLPGMYNLRLPLTEFSKKGIYTIYIRPKEIYGKIYGVSNLTLYPSIKGIVLDSTQFGGDSSIFENGGLVGYRVEYFDSSGNREKYYRIITSSNKCEPVAQNLIDSSQTGVSYRYNNSSNLVFCTLTPSTALSFKTTDSPNIGKPLQTIALVNTKFNPVMLEVEMVDHDIDTVSTMLEGKQIRNLDNAIITTFNSEDGIYHQAMYGNIVNANTGMHHDFKIPMTDTINFNESDKLKEIEENL
jgi:hypothetical protein